MRTETRIGVEIRDLNRQMLYRTVSARLGSRPKIYYPASGADPVPAHVFGDTIIYGTIHSGFIQSVRSPETAGQLPRYREFASEHGGSPNLKAIFAKVEESPFPGNTFDMVLLRCAYRYDDLFLSEIKRILKPRGILIYEDEANEYDKVLKIDHAKFDRGFAALKKLGFTEHPLDRTFPKNLNPMRILQKRH